MYSDHHIIQCATLYYSGSSPQHTPPSSVSPRSFDNLNFFSEETNWADLEEELDKHDWESAFQGLDISEMMSHFLEVCLDAAMKYVPAKQEKSGNPSTGHIPRDSPKYLADPRVEDPRSARKLSRLFRRTLRVKIDALSNIIKIKSHLAKSFHIWI